MRLMSADEVTCHNRKSELASVEEEQLPDEIDKQTRFRLGSQGSIKTQNNNPAGDTG